MKTKTVDIEGQKFTIAPMTVAQVERYLEETESPDDKEKGKQFKLRTYDLICCGLNNARPNVVQHGTPVDAEWTHERVRNELDWTTYMTLQREILDYSGLKIVSRESGAGEAQAPVPATIQ